MRFNYSAEVASLLHHLSYMYPHYLIFKAAEAGRHEDAVRVVMTHFIAQLHSVKLDPVTAAASISSHFTALPHAS